jgi:hypothetical protein
VLDQRYPEYYYQAVDRKTYNMLNWILIALVAMLPLRGVQAIEQVNCQMQDQSSMEMIDYGMHAGHDMSDIAGIEADKQHDCCCCDNGMNCSGDCGMGIGASFIMQSTISVPVVNTTALRTQYNSSLASGTFSPPIRPPANLQI